MDYKITNYSKLKAKQLNVEIVPSTNKNKKIDVYKNNKKVASIGALGYSDYPTYILKNGKSYADERKRLYNIRHKNDSGINGYYAKKNMMVIL